MSSIVTSMVPPVTSTPRGNMPGSMKRFSRSHVEASHFVVGSSEALTSMVLGSSKVPTPLVLHMHVARRLKHDFAEHSVFSAMHVKKVLGMVPTQKRRQESTCATRQKKTSILKARMTAGLKSKASLSLLMKRPRRQTRVSLRSLSILKMRSSLVTLPFSDSSPPPPYLRMNSRGTDPTRSMRNQPRMYWAAIDGREVTSSVSPFSLTRTWAVMKLSIMSMRKMQSMPNSNQKRFSRFCASNLRGGSPPPNVSMVPLG
mmetsp:Transcript_16429/g.41503  ORF Transcript_16429/g.41503 Transcript_16429/m.41503 type:complete len:258 (+) Transcript_16429:1606-2379(+)